MVCSVDIIFLMIVVAFLFARLYSVFGSRSEENNIRVIIKPADKQARKKLEENLESVQSIIKEHAPNAESIVIDLENMSEQDKLLMQIPNFNKNGFINSACKVFEMVLQAFYSGKMESVRNLLNKKVYDSFNDVINYRQDNNITSEVDFICFEKSEIKDVKILKNSVKIIMEFVSRQVNILRNAKGEVIEGDENFIQQITDTWTFERMLNAKTNNWTLVSTKKQA